MLATFTHVKIPYDLYFEEVHPVESFEFNIIAGDTLKALDSILVKHRPTILYLAKRNSRYAGRCKYLEVRQVLRRLSKRFKAPVRRQGTDPGGRRESPRSRYQEGAGGPQGLPG